MQEWETPCDNLHRAFRLQGSHTRDCESTGPGGCVPSGPSFDHEVIKSLFSSAVALTLEGSSRISFHSTLEEGVLQAACQRSLIQHHGR